MQSIPYTKGSKNVNFILFVLSTLFFMWGLITVLNFMLVDELITVLALDPFHAHIINLAFFGTYFFAAFPAGMIIDKIGFKNGMLTGIIIAGFGCMVFYPAAAQKSYELFLTAMVMLATGITFLQVGANPYVSLIGKRGKGASRLTLTQAFNSFGAMLAPIFATSILLRMVDLNEHSMENMSPDEIRAAMLHHVEVPYLVFGAVLFALALFIAFCKLPDIQTEDVPPLVKDDEPPRTSIFQFTHTLLGALAIFVYVGAEVAIARYLAFHAEDLTRYYWGLSMVGRFIGAVVLTQVSPRKSMTICSIAASILMLAFIFIDSSAALYTMVAIGLFNSVLFPCLFTMGIDGLGKYTESGSSLLTMAIVGGAVIPFIVSPGESKMMFSILVLCYAYIAYYAFYGSRYQKRTNFY